MSYCDSLNTVIMVQYSYPGPVGEHEEHSSADAHSPASFSQARARSCARPRRACAPVYHGFKDVVKPTSGGAPSGKQASCEWHSNPCLHAHPTSIFLHSLHKTSTSRAPVTNFPPHQLPFLHVMFKVKKQKKELALVA